MEKKMNPIYPNSQFKSFCYIKSVITRPNIIAGDYSYYDDSDDGVDNPHWAMAYMKSNLTDDKNDNVTT